MSGSKSNRGLNWLIASLRGPLVGLVVSAIFASFVPTSLFADEPPNITVNLGSTVDEGFTVNLLGGLEASDVDTLPSNLVYTLTTPPSRGELRNGGVLVVASSTFTQSDINTGDMSYEHDGGESSGDFFFDDIFIFELSDGINILEDKFFTITITSLDDAPLVASNAGLTLLEGDGELITAGNLKVDDVDTSADDLIFTLTEIPSHGVLLMGGTPLSISGSFSQGDINRGIIRYQHDGSEVLNDTFDFEIGDGTSILSAEIFVFAIIPLDDAPVIVTNQKIVLAQGGVTIITAANLDADDVDTPSSQLQYTLTTTPTHGLLLRDGAPLGVSDTFTQSDIDSNLLSYQHDGSEESGIGFPFDDFFIFDLSDGTTTLRNNYFHKKIVFAVIFTHGFESFAISSHVRSSTGALLANRPMRTRGS